MEYNVQEENRGEVQGSLPCRPKRLPSLQGQLQLLRSTTKQDQRPASHQITSHRIASHPTRATMNKQHAPAEREEKGKFRTRNLVVASLFTHPWIGNFPPHFQTSKYVPDQIIKISWVPSVHTDRQPARSQSRWKNPCVGFDAESAPSNKKKGKENG